MPWTNSSTSTPTLQLSPTPTERLAAACETGDVTGVSTAVADGANVNVKCVRDGDAAQPIALAIKHDHFDVVVQLLRLGVDASSGGYYYALAAHSSLAVLQLLVDAGCGINVPGFMTIIMAVAGTSSRGMERLQLLMSQPTLDVGRRPLTMDDEARRMGHVHVMSLVADEVRALGRSGNADRCSACVRSCSGVAKPVATASGVGLV